MDIFILFVWKYGHLISNLVGVVYFYLHTDYFH